MGGFWRRNLHIPRVNIQGYAKDKLDDLIVILNACLSGCMVHKVFVKSGPVTK